MSIYYQISIIIFILILNISDLDNREQMTINRIIKIEEK